MDAGKVSTGQRDYFGWLGICVLIFVLAMAVRGLHLRQIRTAPFFDLPMGDAEIYDVWARQIAGGDWLGNKVFYHPPLYAYFLAAIYRVLGSSVLIVRLIQIIIGSFSCVLLADSGRRLFSKPIGLLAGLMLALYAPAIFYDALFHKSALDSFFLCLTIWLLSLLTAGPCRGLLWFSAGLVMGCMVLTRENALIFIAVIIFWLLVHHRNLGSRRLVFAAVFLAGSAILLVPVAIRNKVIGGHYLLTTSNFGRNFYIGNGENATGFYRPMRQGRGHARFELDDDTQLAEKAAGRKLGPAEVSAYWTRQTIKYIRSNPARWLSLMLKKAVLVCNAAEIADTEDQYTYMSWSAPLRLSGCVCHFGLIAPLALFGLCATWGQRKKLWLFYLMLAGYAASVVIFYVFGRYRYPMVPFLVLFASAGLVEARRFLRNTSTAHIVACVAAIIAAGVVSNWPIVPKTIMQAMTLTNIGSEFILRGNLQEAVKYYRQAIQISPDYAEAHANLAVVLESENRFEEAAIHYRRVVQLRPDDTEVHYKLGKILSAQGKSEEAAGEYEIVLEAEPNSFEAHYNLGNILKSRGELDKAVSHYYKALTVKSDDADTHNNLANALRQQGKTDDAISHYLLAIRIKPDYATAHSNLGYVLMDKGQLDEAIVHIEQAAGLTKYQNATILSSLSAAYAAKGRFDEATKTALKALNIAVAERNDRLANFVRRQLEMYKQGKTLK